MFYATSRKLVKSELTYDWEQGPRQMRAAQAEGRLNRINCVSLSHLALESAFGVRLPSGMHLDEIRRDIASCNGKFFRPVSREPHDWQAGDIALSGLARPTAALDRFTPQYDDQGNLINWRESPLRHAAMYTGIWDEATDQPLMLHASAKAGIEVATLSDIMNMEKGHHATLYDVGRLIVAHENREAA